MGKQASKKSQVGQRNDSRNNGKAAKQAPGKTNHREKLSQMDLILMGKGLYRQVESRVNAEKLRMKSKSPSKTSSNN